MNHIVILGRLTRDPELKNVQGSNLVTCSIAHSKKFKKGDEVKEKTSFFEIKVWGKTAINFAEFHSKGSLALIEGELEQETWDAPEGGKRSKVVLNVSRWHFVGKKSDSSQPATSFDEMGDPVGDDDIPF